MNLSSSVKVDYNSERAGFLSHPVPTVNEDWIRKANWDRAIQKSFFWGRMYGGSSIVFPKTYKALIKRVRKIK